MIDMNSIVINNTEPIHTKIFHEDGKTYVEYKALIECKNIFTNENIKLILEIPKMNFVFDRIEICKESNNLSVSTNFFVTKDNVAYKIYEINSMEYREKYLDKLLKDTY